MTSLLSLAALALSAPAVAASCDDQSEIVWVQPSTAKYGFAADSVFRVLVGGGDSPASEFTVQLNYREEPVPATVEVSAHPGESRFEDRYLYTLVPDEPLAMGERYTLVVTHASGDPELGYEVSTLVGEEQPADPVGAPSLNARTKEEVSGAGEGMCDFSVSDVYTLTVVPAAADPTERSVLHIYRMASEDSEWHYVRAQRAPSDGAELEVTLAFEPSEAWGDCFVVVQEDAHGQQSAPSAMSCVSGRLDPSDDEGQAEPLEPVVEEPRASGCSSVGGLAGFTLLWAAVLAVATRREE